MEQAWNSFFWGVRQLFIDAASPFVALSHAAGLDLNAAQVWMLFFTLVFLAFLLSFLYDELVLGRRGRRTTGTVVGIDPGDESPDRPVIEFRDHSGRKVVFTSYRAVNAMTATIGAPVEVVFDPLRPKRAREAGKTDLLSLHFVFLVFLVGAMVFATVMARDAVY
jgi:hypothetical protein